LDTDLTEPKSIQDAPAAQKTLPAPDRRIDAALHRRHRSFVLDLKSGPIADGIPVPHYTKSLDAIIDLAAVVLPGWNYGVSLFADSCEVWLQPDAAHIDQGSGLHAVFPAAPRGAMPLLAVLIEVAEALTAGAAPDPNLPRAHAFFEAAITARLHPFA